MLITIGIVLLDLKCRMAGGMLVKMNRANKENAQENHSAIEIRGTHTTLRCCVAVCAGNPQKTANIGPRAIHKRPRIALCRAYQPYGLSLLSSYFNGLENRSQFCSLLCGER
jgi:5-enolpyruvylshikimate-3-phosphate synthase